VKGGKIVLDQSKHKSPITSTNIFTYIIMPAAAVFWNRDIRSTAKKSIVKVNIILTVGMCSVVLLVAPFLTEAT